jgi:NTE family protein
MADMFATSQISDPASDEQTDTVASDLYAKPKDPDGIGLCLSGGGFRAMTFHLGSLRRLNEAGLMRKLSRVSSVSGGSITAGVLALAWKDLAWQEDVATNFAELVEQPIFRYAGTSVDVVSVLRGLVPGRIAAKVADSYDKHLFHRQTLQDLPTDETGPRFIFCSTNLGNGTLFRFSRPYMADWKTGTFANPTTRVAIAVAASSAFPPVLSPAMIDLPDGRTVTLTDGGVYDNLGLEPVKKNCGTLFVSDGGGTFKIKTKPRRDWVLGTRRLLDVLDVEVRRLRRREIVGAFAAGYRKGAFWAVNTNPAAFKNPAAALPCTYQQTNVLALVPTRLKKMSDQAMNQIANWGYVAADASLRDNYDGDLPEPDHFPYRFGVG